MTTADAGSFRSWPGQPAVDSDGHKVGHVLHVFVGDADGKPKWAVLDTNMFTSRRSFVPLAGSRVDGDTLVLGYHKELIKKAPQVDDEGALDADDEQRLYAHYGGPASLGH